MKNNFSTRKIAQIGIFAALSYIGFQFLRIDIPVGTQKTAFHMGNVFLMVAALTIGGLEGGLSGAIGMTIADMTSGYMTSAPATFILKLCIGLIVGLFMRLLKVRHEENRQKRILKLVLATGAGAVFNIIADPLIRYIFNLFIYKIRGDLAAKLAAISSITTIVNAILAIVFSTILFEALRPSLNKMKIL